MAAGVNLPRSGQSARHAPDVANGARMDPSRRTPPLSSSRILLGLFALRLVNALTLRTFFQPDEYFQSLEPAWQIAFGRDSGAWITWEWKLRLRSYLHPALFSIVYRAASGLASGLDCAPHLQTEILVAAPKVAQAAFGTLIDFYTWKLARRTYGPESRAALAALALTVTSPWQWFCSTRTFSNSLETALTAAALYLWPWHWSARLTNADAFDSDGLRCEPRALSSNRSPSQLPSLRLTLCLAGFACVIRPTNVLIWLVLYLSIVMSAPKGVIREQIALTREAILCGSAIIAASSIVERLYHGTWTIPALQFLYFNVGQSIGDFYGINRPFYYLIEGLPLLLTTAVFFAPSGLWRALRSFLSARKEAAGGTAESSERRVTCWLAAICGLVISAFSTLSHKEVRFIYPLLPPLLVLAAGPLSDFFDHLTRRKKAIAVCLLAVNIVVAYYVSQIHQRGVIDVITFLRHEHERKARPKATDDIGVITTAAFLMPCHSTPWRSDLVYRGISAWALTCEPPVHVTKRERAGYMDEADVFYADPVAWLETNMADRPTRTRSKPENPAESKRAWPEYLVFFEQLEKTMDDYLPDAPYRECWRGFNTHWHDDWRRKGDVVVWCRN